MDCCKIEQGIPWKSYEVRIILNYIILTKKRRSLIESFKKLFKSFKKLFKS